MEFLKGLLNKEEASIEVKKSLRITIQCDNCDYWGKMDGGTLETEQAVFACPECKTLKYIKWGNIG